MASRYAIKNFEEIEPSGADGIDARFSRKFLDSTELGVSRWRYEPGRQTPGHRHEVQEEVYTVINGSGSVKLDDEVIEIRQWDVIRVAPNVARGFEAGPDGLEIVAAGGSKPEGGDGSLVEDHWSGDK
jgi:quercetin dioxygenase-like cupin family protein